MHYIHCMGAYVATDDIVTTINITAIESTTNNKESLASLFILYMTVVMNDQYLMA